MEIPEGFANCRFVFTCSGVLDEMGCSIGLQGDIGETAQSLAENAYAAFQVSFAAAPSALLTGWTWQGTRVTMTVAAQPVVGEKIVPVVGTGGTDGVVCNTGVLVRKNTAAGGRKNRGRMYVPPFNLQENNIAPSGHLIPTYVEAQTDKWADVLAALAVNTVFPWLLHSDPADTPTPITSLTAQGLAVTQRRRMR